MAKNDTQGWKVGRSEWIRMLMQAMVGRYDHIEQPKFADIVKQLEYSSLDGSDKDFDEWNRWLSAIEDKIAGLKEEKEFSLFPDIIDDEIADMERAAEVLRNWIEQVRIADEEEKKRRKERNKKYAKNKQKKRDEGMSSVLVPITKSYLKSTLRLQTQTDLNAIKKELPMEDKVSINLVNGNNFGERIVTREFIEKSLDILLPIVGERRFDCTDSDSIDVTLGKEELRRYVGMTYASSTIISDEILDKIVSGWLFWDSKKIVWQRGSSITLAQVLTIKYDADIIDGHTANDKWTLHIWLPPFTGINAKKYVLDKAVMTKPLAHLVDGDSVAQRVKTIIATTQSHMSEKDLFESAYRLSEKNPESVRKNMSRTRQQMDRIFKKLKDENIILSYRRYKNKDGECVWEWTKKSVKN